MVYSGPVTKLRLNDAEIAAVLGHEISHALREHTRERVSRSYEEQAALVGLALLTGGGPGTMELADQVASVTFELPHDPQQEAEADVMGLELMALAGYEPHEAISLWKKMMPAEKSEPPRTHPASTNRITELEHYMPQVFPLYLAAAPKTAAAL